MIEAKEFVEKARSFIGEPYSKMDCIAVVRKAAGISCKGTNWLWRSVDNSAKYRYLTKRGKDSTSEMGKIAGLLVFRISWNQIPDGYDDKPNCYHVGILTGSGTVIQSQEKSGVTEKPYDPGQWQGYGYLKQVQYQTDPLEKTEDPAYPSDHEMLCAIYDYLIRN